jgi:hypothetical protein
MRYRQSTYYKTFKTKIGSLLKASKLAMNEPEVPSSVRDLAFQCSILQTSAAIEEYIRTLFDGWAFELSKKQLTASPLPHRTKLAIAKEKLSTHFTQYLFQKDEKEFLRKLDAEAHLWPLLTGQTFVPVSFDGSVVYSERKYPSGKNIKVLFSRIGVDNIFDLLSRHVAADAEFQLKSFNDIRTALAHSNPPQLTLLDVERNLQTITKLVNAMDKVVHQTLSRHLGSAIW